jgi:hypothetical protein
MTDEELKNRLAAIEKEQARIREMLSSESPPRTINVRAIHVPVHVPQERLDELERQLERQNSLIEVLRELLPEFAQKFDKLCSDKEKSILSTPAPDVAKALFPEEES